MQDSQQNFYDVAYTNADGKIRYYARGMTLDRAQVAKAYLVANGITIDRTGSDGFQGGAITTEAVTEERVVRSARRGEASVAELTEELTVTTATSGAEFYAELTNDFTPGSVTVTVNASGHDYVGVEELSDNNIIIRVKDGSILAITDAVSATSSYKTTSDTVTVTAEDHDSDVNGTETTFELTNVYMPETVTITTDATGSISVIEGGGKYIEVLENGIAIPSGKTLRVSYIYGPQDNTTVPASETFSWSPPVWVGTERHPPFA